VPFSGVPRDGGAFRAGLANYSIRAWSRSGLAICYRAVPCVWIKLRTRSIVRSFSSGGDFQGNTVISAFGASEATSTDV